MLPSSINNVLYVPTLSYVNVGKANLTNDYVAHDHRLVVWLKLTAMCKNCFIIFHGVCLIWSFCCAWKVEPWSYVITQVPDGNAGPCETVRVQVKFSLHFVVFQRAPALSPRIEHLRKKMFFGE